MFKWLGSLVDSNEKEIKRLEPIVDKINKLEPEFEKLDNSQLRAKTEEFKSRFVQEERLDDLLPEAFAAVREAAKRTIKQRHYDVQLIGGITLHQGKIAEMKTGEGKTLVATLPLYLNALAGKGCHLVTVNDYLARRDAHWMGSIYHALGMTVASIFPQQNPDEYLPAYLYDPDSEGESADKRWPHFRSVSRNEAYAADITYGTNNEFGFDYLRDNMVLDLSQCVQRELNYAIVDEVDNILIDEARTPLIISGAAEEAADKYHIFARSVLPLKKEEDYTVDEKTRTVALTDEGITRMEKILRSEGVLKSPSLYDTANYGLMQYLENALKAQVIFKKDRDYVVKDEQVIIVDEFTGRLMFGRRYSEGLHQSIEAKEKVKIQRESITLATITFQNYFRLYKKLAGMTGTAATEAEEFYKIYKLDVLSVPTNKPMIRKDQPDQIYKDEESKFKAVANEIERLHHQRSPVLVGTVSIEKSEYLSEFLKRKGIPHQLLNAKNHTKEAGIIAEAGKTSAVTVATNMAGRGVDIILGGRLPEDQEESDSKESDFNREKALEAEKVNKGKKSFNDWQEEHDKVVATGGLHVIGTERHEARRIDNQLRGRAGRQGDPGSTRFYVSLEDDIVKRFGGDRIKGLMEWAGMDENTPIEHSMINKAIENAQTRVEGYHFDIRKHLVEYDDIVNKHREIIYAERRKILSGTDLKTNILSMVREEIQDMVASRCDKAYEEPDLSGLIQDLADILPSPLPSEVNENALSEMRPEEISKTLIKYTEQLYQANENRLGTPDMRWLEGLVMLGVIDSLWKDHLTSMDHLRQTVGLQSVRQIDPLVVYKKEGGSYFDSLVALIKHDVVHTIYRPDKVAQVAIKAIAHFDRERINRLFSLLEKFGIKFQFAQKPSGQQQPQRATAPATKKVGRNDPCPCGSGKKYKHCCGG
jgi:preprotein translocase subunit SecA